MIGVTLLDMTIACNDFGHLETSEQWHAALLLPEDYQIKQIDRQGSLIMFYIEYPDIPGAQPDVTRLINLCYRVEKAEKSTKFSPDHVELISTRKVYLDHIEIMGWQNEQWKQVK